MILDNWQHEKYSVVKHITNGGTSKIFLTELKDGTRAILKVAKDPVFINNKQLDNEASLLKKLNHPAIPTLIDYLSVDEYKAIVMTLMEGRNLKHIIDVKDYQYNWQETLYIGKQLAGIIKYFHRQEPQVVIRDIKPSNVVIDKKLTVKLVDFGTSSDDTNIIHNKAFGTVGFAAPEQFENGVVDKRSDIFALGATLYYVISNGGNIYTQSSLFEETDAPRKLKEFIYRCTKSSMDQRYQTIDEVISELEKINETTLEKIIRYFNSKS